jgi:hypothetical protein
MDDTLGTPTKRNHEEFRFGDLFYANVQTATLMTKPKSSVMVAGTLTGSDHLPFTTAIGTWEMGLEEGQPPLALLKSKVRIIKY